MIVNIQDFNFEDIPFLPVEGTGDAVISDFKCHFPSCNRTFRFKSEFKRHIAIHDTQRPYICSFQDCNKAFKRLDALTTHVRVHTGEKPYTCPVGSCELQFSTKAGLRYHVLKHKNDKIFRCDFPRCEQSFLTLTQLNQHKKRIRVHDTLLNLPLTFTDIQERFAEQKETVEPNAVINEPSCFEPPILKHQQVEPLFESHYENIHCPHNSSVAESVKPLEKLQQHLENHTRLETHSQNLLNCAFPSDPILPEGTFDSLWYPTAVHHDQASLLKRISNILDENTLLKQHIQIYQKMIEVCQITINGNPLISVINSLKSSNLSLKNLS